jgi:type IV secretory pathway TraG/TraD family ATPase VirD4
VASRHLGNAKSNEFFSIYLDDFTEYITESFVSLLNKSRSANVGVVFAHQALGDLAALGDGVKNTILSNSNLKIFMRTNEPESAEYFSQTVGTIQGLKKTEREKSSTFGARKTGDASVRDVEEFKFHPNLFKQQLGVGEAVMILPHANGSLPVRIQFRKVPDLIDHCKFPHILKQEPKRLPLLPSKEEELKKLTDANLANNITKILNSEPKPSAKEVS